MADEVVQNSTDSSNWESDNATDWWYTTEVYTTATPIVGDMMVRATANESYCETCPRPLSTKGPDGEMLINIYVLDKKLIIIILIIIIMRIFI